MQKVCVERLNTCHLKFFKGKVTVRQLTGGLLVQLFTRCWSAFHLSTQKLEKHFTRTSSMRSLNQITSFCLTMQEIYAPSCFKRIPTRGLEALKPMLKKSCAIHGSNALIGRKSKVKPLLLHTDLNSTDQMMLSISLLSSLDYNQVPKTLKASKQVAILRSQTSHTKKKTQSL